MSPSSPTWIALLAIGTLTLGLAPAAHAQEIPACADPQFRIGPQVLVSVPEGTYWTPGGDLHEYGTTYHYGVWADNRGGVAAACVRLESTSAYDSCVKCIIQEA